MLAIIYSNRSQECQRAVALLESLEQKFIQYELNRDFSIKQFYEEFGTEAEFPQVTIYEYYVGIAHVGGLKETLNYYKNKNLL